jgi:Rps23 Pro-64 3,4-dihydroxylase Tpa1-like proline 4-hydroxylase
MYAAWTGVEEAFPGVFRYKNFYSDSDCRSLVASAETTKHWISAPIGRYQDNVLVESKVDPDLRDVLVADLKEAGIAFPTPNIETLRQDVVARFGAPIDVMSRGMISKYVVGSHIRAHRDTGVYSTNRLVTCVAYLNDQYEGGALTFPQFGGSLSPNRGDCVCFYSELLHGVNEITAGTRYCIVWFGESSLVDTR